MPNVTFPMGSARYLAALGLEDKAPPDVLVEWVLACTLAEGALAGMTADEAAASIKARTGLTFDRAELLRCATAAAAKGLSVTRQEVPRLSISTAAREETLLRLSQADALETRVLDEWIAELQAEGPLLVDGGLLKADFKKFYQQVAMAHGMEIVAVVFDQENAAELLHNVDEKIWKDLPERAAGYRDYCKHVFPLFFLSAKGVRATYIAAIVDRTFELCRFNLSKESSDLLLARLQGSAVYLDTNILFRLFVLHGPVAHLDARRVLELSRRAKCQIRVTERTLEEFDVAASAVIRDRHLALPPPEALLSLDANLKDEEFYFEYFKLLSRQRLSPADLVAVMRGAKHAVEAFGIKVSSEKVPETVGAASDVRELANALLDDYRAAQQRRPPQDRREVTWEQAEHDAFHVVLVKKLRPPYASTFSDAKFWFLTMHYTLVRCARRASRKLPTVMLLEQWHQLLRSMLPRSDEFDETFVRNLRSSIFLAHRANYQAAVEAVGGRLAAMSKLPAENCAAIVADAAFMVRVSSTIEQREPAKLTGLMEERLARELSAQKDEKIRSARRNEESLTRANREAEQQRERYEAMQREAQALSERLDSQRKEQGARLEQEKAARLLAERKVALWSKGVLVGSVSLLVILLWAYLRDGWAVRGTGLSMVATTAALVGICLMALLPTRRKLIGGILLAIFAFLQIQPWSKGEQVATTSANIPSSADAGILSPTPSLVPPPRPIVGAVPATLDGGAESTDAGRHR